MGGGGVGCSNPAPGPYRVILWKNVRQGWTKVKWHDQWCRQNSLAICFPELFTISHAKAGSVANLSMFTYGVLH